MTASAPGPEAPGPDLAPGRPNVPSPPRRSAMRLAEETRTEKYVWWSLGYFFFGIHIVAFVMIYAVTHAR